jgi:hypothetical protein
MRFWPNREKSMVSIEDIILLDFDVIIVSILVLSH